MKRGAPLSDEQFVERARGGDYPAFEALVDRYGPLVYTFALLREKTPGSAEEVTLSTFVSAIENLAGFGRSDTFGTWLLTIAVHETNRVCDGECGRRRL